MAGMIRNLVAAAVGTAARRKTEGRGILAFGVGFVATRLATRSIPGALIVGAGLVAKSMLDQKKERDAKPNTTKEMVRRNPDVVREIAIEDPGMLTDAHDDPALKRAIRARR